MTVRPYGSLKIEQLEALAKSSADDEEVLRRLLAELQHRRMPRAQRLRSQLEGLLPPQLRGKSVPAQPGKWSTALTPELATFPQRPSIEVDSSTPISTKEFRALFAAYESIRATFTVEGELLARWGMTPELPGDLQDLIFEEWRKRLPDSPSHSGRSLKALAEDRIRILRERDALQRALKAHGIPTPGDCNNEPFNGENQ